MYLKLNKGRKNVCYYFFFFAEYNYTIELSLVKPITWGLRLVNRPDHEPSQKTKNKNP